MLKARIRKALVIVAATLTLVVALVPAASAMPNDHRFDRSGEAWKQKNGGNANYCGDMLDVYNGYDYQIGQAVKAGNYVLSFQLVDQKAKDRATAKKAGCSWAWV